MCATTLSLCATLNHCQHRSPISPLESFGVILDQIEKNPY
jgi:hypothetical protein